jgi:hypothetical protein
MYVEEQMKIDEMHLKKWLLSQRTRAINILVWCMCFGIELDLSYHLTTQLQLASTSPTAAIVLALHK